MCVRSDKTKKKKNVILNLPPRSTYLIGRYISAFDVETFLLEN